MNDETMSGPGHGTAKKYSVSMPEDIAAEVRERVGKGSFSAYVTAAVRRQIEREQLAELVDDLDRRNGPPSETALAQADREFDEAERRYATWLAAQQHGDPLAG